MHMAAYDTLIVGAFARKRAEAPRLLRLVLVVCWFPGDARESSVLRAVRSRVMAVLPKADQVWATRAGGGGGDCPQMRMPG